MKTSFRPLIVALAAISAPTASWAIIVPPIAPTPLTQWDLHADTLCVPARDKHGTSAVLGKFQNFNPPVLAQKGRGLLAFRGTLQPGVAPSGVTISSLNNDGVWGNGGPFSQNVAPPSFSPVWNILQEGDSLKAPFPNYLYGNGAGVLSVANLQVNASGHTIGAANTTAPGGRAYWVDNCGLSEFAVAQNPAGIAPWLMLNLPVQDERNSRYAGWARRNFTPSGTMSFSPAGFFTPPLSPLTAAPVTFATTPAPALGHVGNFQPHSARPGSPSISAMGEIASFAIDQFAVPAMSRNHIVLDQNPTQTIIVRQGDPSPIALERFGVIHPSLMANCDGGNLPTVAWQQATMLTGAFAPIPLSTSLWVWNNAVRTQLARVNTPAPDLPGFTITSFYALHASQNLTGGPATSYVTYGCRVQGLGGIRKAIYAVDVTAGVVGTPHLVATNVPGVSNTLPALSAATTILDFADFFSTNMQGEVLINAQLAVAPAGQDRVLLVAKPSNNWALSCRAQTGMVTTQTACGFLRLNSFQLATPEQGTHSRGQAMNAGGEIGFRAGVTSTTAPRRYP
jgi:hypothetical protein